MIKLSLRLETIAKMVPNSVVADVGSDHGKLMISLFENGQITKGYAIENKKGPFQRLCKALEANNLEDFIVPLLSDGITDLPECVETVVIAGMGGQNIINILESHPEKLKNVKTIIVDAHSCLTEVRQSISKMGYIIADERIIKDQDIFYEIIKFIKADIAFYTDKDFEFGPILRKEKSALFKEKYEQRISEIDHLLEKKLPQERLDELKGEKNKLLGVI